MKKYVRILSLVVALAMLFALVACDPNNPDGPDKPPVIGGDDHVCKHICSECGKCTDSECTNNVCSQKCQGHEQQHICSHLCSACGKCTDATCTNQACADKCQGHVAHVCSHICAVCGKCTDATCSDAVCADKCQGHAVAHVCGHVCSECGKCTDGSCLDAVCADKCQGHGDMHICSHICSACGKCTDGSCLDAACADKCQGHSQAHICSHICGQCGKCTDTTCTNEACADKCQCESGSIHNNPVEGAVVLTKAQGHLESAYVTWQIDTNAKWYNVYCKAASDAEYGKKIDEPLVRKYSDYFRADVVGLKAGKYDIKVVPVNSDGTEATEFASEATSITVLAHERYGFAFVNGTSSGAYNDDGTLKSNARVIYITEKTKNTVSMDVTGANSNPCVGLQEILDGYKKGKDTRPLCIRMVGNITDFSYMLNGDIVIENKNNSAAGITFEGIGNDATANGWGIRVKNASNIEIRNIGFMNTNSDEGDDVGLQQDNDHIWVHNCDLFYGQPGGDADQAKGDGALDTKGSTNVTHSYNHFWDCGKCNLQGMKSETTSNCITYHHNWYDHSDSRHPRVRTCTVHVFNNYFDGNAKYCVGATTGSSIFVENNYFRSETKMRPMLISMQGTDIEFGQGTFSSESGGMIKSYGNKYEGSGALALVPYSAINNVEFDCYEASSRDEQVPSYVTAKKGGTSYNNFDTAPDMYNYIVDSPDVAKAKVQQFAGRVDGGDFKFTFDNAKDDADYDVNVALQQALLNYKTTVQEIGELPGGSTGGDNGGNGGNGGEDLPIGPIEGAIVSSFEGGKASNSAISVSGSAKNASLEIKALGQTFGSGVKMEKTTSITFTTTEKMTLTLYFDVSGKNVKVDGVEYTSVVTAQGDNIIVVELEAGAHSITKKSSSINLYYLVLTLVEAE